MLELDSYEGLSSTLFAVGLTKTDPNVLSGTIFLTSVVDKFPRASLFSLLSGRALTPAYAPYYAKFYSVVFFT